MIAEEEVAKTKRSNIRLFAVNKSENDIFLLRSRPDRVYIKRALKLLKTK